jgi:hypothetical protein
LATTRGHRIAVAMLWLCVVLFVASIVVWIIAIPTGWLYSVAFVSHVSMAALAFAALAGIGSALAAMYAEDSSN